jgi:hypothetical protein
MKEKLIKWSPVEGIPKVLYVEGLHDDYEGFRILLKGEGSKSRMLRITFDPALAYRNVDDGDRLKSLSEWAGDEDWSLFTIENSAFIDWFIDENHPKYDRYDRENIVHYSIMTPNDIVDVISEFKPKVEWLN